MLSYSLHYLLRALTSTSSSDPSPSSSPSSPLAVGDLDPCLELVSGILIEDLFGVPAEERESGENVAKIPESKTPQSYNSYEIVSQYLSPKLLPDLLSPVKEVGYSETTPMYRVRPQLMRYPGELGRRNKMCASTSPYMASKEFWLHFYVSNQAA